MAITSGFFNSVDGDRLYDAEDFGRLFDGIIDDGVLKGEGTEFAVTAKGGLNLGVGAGRSWFNSTWLLNDAEAPMTAATAHSTLNRIDAIILDVDRTDAVRRATIEYVTGTAAANPVRPSLLQTPEVKQYALAYISRSAGATSVSQSHITNMVGTPETPFAVSRLLDRTFEPSWAHRNVFRGKNLGNSYTAAQKQAVASGSFEDLYVGDYWEIDGVKWRIVDMNYYLNRGRVDGTVNNVVTRNHLMIMPDSTLRRCKMNDNLNGTSGGYTRNGVLRQRDFAPVFSYIQSLFGLDNMLVWSDIYINNMTPAKPNSADWLTARMELPSAAQIAGWNPFTYGADGANVPPRVDKVGTAQFSLFRLAPWFARAEPNQKIMGQFPVETRDYVTRPYWTCDPASAHYYVVIADGLSINIVTAEQNLRPVFGLW